jgi:hypothetical protein
MILVNVHFTTLVLSGDEVLHKPQVINGLPLSTAQTYKRFGNWRTEPYVAESHDRRPRGVTRGEVKTYSSAKSKGKSALHHAAATGDLAAAISGVK